MLERLVITELRRSRLCPGRNDVIVDIMRGSAVRFIMSFVRIRFSTPHHGKTPCRDSTRTRPRVTRTSYMVPRFSDSTTPLRPHGESDHETDTPEKHVHLPAPDAPHTVAMRRRTADLRTRPPHTACNRTAARSARSPRDHVESARARALVLNGHKANGAGSLAQQRTGYQNGPHFTPRLRVISPWALRVAARARATASVTS